MNHIKYAVRRWFYWFSVLAVFWGVLAIFPIPRNKAIFVVMTVFILAFAIPLISSFVRKNFSLDMLGKSKVTLVFDDLFEQDCFVVTTNRYFDVNPTGEFISEDSLLAKFIDRFYHENVIELENTIRQMVSLDEKGNIIPVEYGNSIKIQINGKIVYLLAFTDRYKKDQPKDFYTKTMQRFLRMAMNENHGKTISIPLIGDNNNLSDAGFANSETVLKALVAMVNTFEIENQRSELRLNIIALPEKRSELIEILSKLGRFLF